MAEEQGIEAARGALIAHLISHCGVAGHPERHCCEPLADAYALAVVEEALADAHSRAAGMQGNCGACGKLVDLRARIEKLGR